MKAVAALSLVFTMAFTLTGCENAEYLECKEKASKLWDPKQDDSKKQTAYWAAIKNCKDRYE